MSKDATLFLDLKIEDFVQITFVFEEIFKYLVWIVGISITSNELAIAVKALFQLLISKFIVK